MMGTERVHRLVFSLFFAISLVIVLTLAQMSHSDSPASASACTTSPSCPNYDATVGIPDVGEPSGMAPPLANALSGYEQTYVTDFSGSTLPTGWSTFTGQPGGDPGARWSASHVVVNNGVLSLNTYQDPNFNNLWTSGGLCQCGHSQTYGAYFVRSRVTGPGPTNVELLWPLSNIWPPEIDFNETHGGEGLTTASVHWSANNQLDFRQVAINMTQWHTWGVIWTPTTVTYLVDGNVWGVVNVASEIPNVPMTLDFQQQTWCTRNAACPTNPQSMLIDWATEYTSQSTTSSPTSSALTTIPIYTDMSSTKFSSVIERVAVTVARRHAHSITINANKAVAHRRTVIITSQIQKVEATLDQDIINLGASAPGIFVRWSNRTTSAWSNLLLTIWR